MGDVVQKFQKYIDTTKKEGSNLEKGQI